jgi:hypothetical protein
MRRSLWLLELEKTATDDDFMFKLGTTRGDV